MMRIFFLSILLAPAVQAAKIPCKIKMPLVHDGCQGDWCAAVHHLMVMDQDIDLVKDLESKTVVQKIKKGTKLKKPFQFDLEIKRPGISKIVDHTFELENSKYTLKRGTVFEMLYNAGQGYYAICVDSDVVKIELKNNAEQLEPVKLEEWIKVKLDGKVSGYVKRSEVRVIDSE